MYPSIINLQAPLLCLVPCFENQNSLKIFHGTDVLEIATTAAANDNYSQKEFVSLVQMAKSIIVKKLKKERNESLGKHLLHFIKESFFTFIRVGFEVR